MSAGRGGFFQGGLGQAVSYASTPGCLRIVFSCRCADDLGSIEELGLLVERWARESELEPDDRAGFLLLLGDFLPDICAKSLALAMGPEGASLEREVVFDLQIGLGQLSAPGLYRGTLAEEPRSSGLEDGLPQCLTLVLKSNLGDFNVSKAQFRRELIEEKSDTGLSNRSLTRLFAIRSAVERHDGQDALVLEFPLSAALPRSMYDAAGENGSGVGEALQRSAKSAPDGFFRRLLQLWRGRLALRQTIFFTFSSLALLWLGIWTFYETVEASGERNALTLSIQAMSTLDSVSTTFLRRVESGVDTLAKGLSTMRFSASLSENSEAMLAVLRGEDFLRNFTREAAFIGIVSGKKGESGAWLYTFEGGDVQKSRLSGVLLADGPEWQKEGRTNWIGPVNGLTGPGVGRHSTIVCALELSAPHGSDKYWIGVILGMTWAENALRGVSGFGQAEPLFLTSRGEYVLYPPGRQAGEGPQTIFQDAFSVDNPALAGAAKRIQAGGKGLAELGGKAGTLPWALPWPGETSILYYPLSIEGWRLALLVPDQVLGRDNVSLPTWLLILGIAGPLLIGLATHASTSRTLGPIRKLADSLENMEKGNLDTPFPQPAIQDETGRMLKAFENTRIILKASLRNLLLNATTQQQLHNELGLARSIQKSMLPDKFPRPDGADISAWLDISREVCGDLYSCFIPDPAAPHIVALVVGDVCGKGVPAALVMSRAMSLAGAVLARGLSPAQALEHINMAILRKDASNMFVTMLIGLFNVKDGTFVYSSAGHPPPVIGPAAGDAGGQGRILPWSKELVLGVMAGIKYSVFSLALSPGQSMLLMTDGADEAMGPAGSAGKNGSGTPEIFGEKRLAKSFADACRKANMGLTAQPREEGRNPAAEIIGHVRQDLLDHMAGLPAHDDITLLVVRRWGDAQTG